MGSAQLSQKCRHGEQCVCVIHCLQHHHWQRCVIAARHTDGTLSRSSNLIVSYAIRASEKKRARLQLRLAVRLSSELNLQARELASCNNSNNNTNFKQQTSWNICTQAVEIMRLPPQVQAGREKHRRIVARACVEKLPPAQVEATAGSEPPMIDT